MEWLLVAWIYAFNNNFDVKVVERFPTETACQAFLAKLMNSRTVWAQRLRYVEFECLSKED